MDIKKTTLLIGLMAVATLTTACSEQMPKVNDETCKVENIQKIKDQELKEQFSSQCFEYNVEKAKDATSALIEQGQDSAKSLYEQSKETVKEAFDASADAAKESSDAISEAWQDGVKATQK